ncbi:MAG: UDP-N-acetylmuramoyl-L-alanine--D-glutamate ligase [Planctomyces sp.]
MQDFSCYSGIRATVMGLGTFGGGIAAAQFLARHGATVTVTDLRREDQLRPSLGELRDVPIHRLALGQHPVEVFEQCDLLVVNPAVKPDDPFVRIAEDAGADVTTEIELFLRHNPAPVIAVTGSNGKSTTTGLIHHLLRHSWESEHRQVHLGGNIGVSLLSTLSKISVSDLVVLELSSFQLEFLRRRKFRPRIAVITNLAPNHLDWHGTAEAYHRAKQGILDAQIRDDAAILPDSGDDASEWRVRARRFTFGTVDHGENGCFAEDGQMTFRGLPLQMHPIEQTSGRSGVMPGDPESEKRRHSTRASSLRESEVEDVLRWSQPAQLPGRHNRLNVAAACCAAWLAGGDTDRFPSALQKWVPLPHRLQLVTEARGRRFYNDSIATTPESAIQALRTFTDRTVLLAGGYDKGQDLSLFAAEIRHRVAVVVLMGKTAETLQTLIAGSGSVNQEVSAGNAPWIAPESETEVAESEDNTSPLVLRGEDFQHSFRLAVESSRSGDIVLLSPGCASYGWFQDYRERGELFTTMAMEWKSAE